MFTIWANFALIFFRDDKCMLKKAATVSLTAHQRKHQKQRKKAHQ